MDSDADLFQNVPLLARLPVEDVRALAACGKARRYANGAVIMREGERGNAFYVVVEGTVRISVASPAGDEATLALLGPGECFGDMAMLDGGPRSATATATSTVRAISISRESFAGWLEGRPAAAMALLGTLAGRIRTTNERIADLEFLDLSRRLAKRLLLLTAAQADGPRTRVRITQAELGAMLGVSRESVNKQLNLFARDGLVSIGRGSVAVLDPEGLRARA